ncbi:MAG: hypothetical protein V4677_16285 [Bacteroidota bacterium]
MRNSILLYGFISALLYIGFLLTMKTLNLMHVTELRLFNYVILCLVCMYQIKRWIIKTGAYVPFLHVFTTVFFTGILSFVLFSSFLYFYTMIDADLNQLFIENAKDVFSFFPTIVILFEGSAISIIVALINLQYFRRYEEGEKAIS